MPIGKVLCLGGSLTVGGDAAFDSHRTYRGALQTALATVGLTLDFIGPNVLAPISGGADSQHAGWADASIDSTGSAGNNLTGRLAQLKTDFPSVDLIIIDPPWWDIVNAPSSLASRYSTFIGALQAGAWASTKILMCTAHPASGQSVAATASSYAAYGPVNAEMETLRAAASTTRFVADLAALTTTTTSAALTELALFYAQKAPDFATLEGGKNVPSWQGGHLVTSFKSIQDFNAQWSLTPPAAGNAPGGMGLSDPNVVSWNGTTNRFVQSVASITPWYWVWCLPGHASTNTCIEVRNAFAAGKRTGGGWEFFFSGARVGDVGQLWDGPAAVGYAADARSRSGYRADGITTWHSPRGNQGFEVWPVDTAPSRGVIDFYGAFNRDLLANSECFWWGNQCRLALIDPNGVDDRSASRFGAACGADFFSTLGGRHYDRIGWPYNAQDGGHDAWSRVDWSDWRMISALTIGREGSPDTGVSADYHWSDPGTPPPLANWSPPTPYNNPTAGRALTATQIRANPLPVPAYWEGGAGTGGTTSGYQVADYFDLSGSRIYLLTQSGAGKVAGVMSTAIIASGALATFTGGGITFEPLPGAATFPNVSLKVNGSSLVNVEPKNWSAPTAAPAWQTTTLPDAIAGTAYSAGLSAPAVPAATYSIVSGAPAWLTINGTTGALGGTPPAGIESTSLVTFRATGSVAVDAQITLRAITLPVITTTTLPAAPIAAAYSVQILTTGTGPISIAVLSGTLPPGLSLVGGFIVGTPTVSTGAYSFTLRATGPGGQTDDQALSIVCVAATGALPVITTSTLPSGTVGTAYLAEIAATGTQPITYGAANLPAGLSLVAGTKNRIRNPSGQGAVVGTPGTAPTNWTTVAPSGASRAITATGTDGGLGFATVRFSGTPSASGVLAVYFDDPTGIPATAGEVVAVSYYQRLVAGTMSGITAPGIVLDSNTAAGAYVANVGGPVSAPTSASLLSQRASVSHPLAGGGTVARVRPYWYAAVTAGVPIDATIQFAAPQLESGSSATFYADPRYAYISGTPTAPGFYVLAATATNSLGTDAAALALTINPAAVVSAAQSGGWGKFIRQ